ncbi:L,D-transpeptidase [Clostridium sp. CX1]|uniref:L,D-transpeptidase family protein n=1 Tax=Clostridium sp. CX1 TaxID=2978346 RepID=UPI0021BDF6AD|nr:L,D-transpeptidase [Clostridium sp. CX1]MCT8976711.1 L,D-transpeptidase [Clostridium sp. CX1]
MCKYYTQISGNYLFHSVLYNKSDKLVDGRLGYNISHGCIRLSLENAKYIYDNIPSGTAIWIQ